MKKVLLAVCAVFLFVVLVNATPIKLSLWEKIATPKDANSVCGLEFGVGDYTPELVGVSWNCIYSKTDSAKGWQLGVIVTISKQFNGLQIGFLSISEAFKGASFGWINWNDGEVSGLQMGLFNISKSISGVQIGFLNMTESMNGIQIGLLNYIKESKVPVMIIANAKF
jgi:hypothetical protein